MCTENQLSIIVNRVAEQAKAIFGNKMRAVILYGSYARGDYDDESDIDIMVLADVPREELSSYKKAFWTLTSELGLAYDIVVTVTLKDVYTFEKYFDAVPFYQAVRKEGVSIAV